MRGEPAGHEMIARVGEGQVTGPRLCRHHIAKLAFRDELPRLLQHLRRDVAGGDLGESWREGERGMSGAGRDVEQAPGRLGLDELQEPRERRAGGMHGGGRVVGGGLTEFLLDKRTH